MLKYWKVSSIKQSFENINYAGIVEMLILMAYLFNMNKGFTQNYQ